MEERYGEQNNVHFIFMQAMVEKKKVEEMSLMSGGKAEEITA